MLQMLLKKLVDRILLLFKWDRYITNLINRNKSPHVSQVKQLIQTDAERFRFLCQIDHFTGCREEIQRLKIDIGTKSISSIRNDIDKLTVKYGRRY